MKDRGTDADTENSRIEWEEGDLTTAQQGCVHMIHEREQRGEKGLK